jgi:septal ring factor EnvC (AmiA/AmiB activator)
VNVDESFGLLEEKVRRAAELVRRVREENRALQDELHRARTRLKETEQELDAGGGKPTADEAQRAETLGREVKALRAERAEVRTRIAKLLEVLDGLE